jgi:hypothetical protein
MTTTTILHCDSCKKELSLREALFVSVEAENPGVYQNNDLHFCSFNCFQSFVGGIILAEAMTV